MAASLFEDPAYAVLGSMWKLSKAADVLPDIHHTHTQSSHKNRLSKANNVPDHNGKKNKPVQTGTGDSESRHVPLEAVALREEGAVASKKPLSSLDETWFPDPFDLKSNVADLARERAIQFYRLALSVLDRERYACSYVYIYIYIYILVYLYKERERQRKRER